MNLRGTISCTPTAQSIPAAWAFGKTFYINPPSINTLESEAVVPGWWVSKDDKACCLRFDCFANPKKLRSDCFANMFTRPRKNTPS